jgi:serine/threonine protein kinase
MGFCSRIRQRLLLKSKSRHHHIPINVIDPTSPSPLSTTLPVSTQVSLCRHNHTHKYAAFKHILPLQSNNPQDLIALQLRQNEPDTFKLAATHPGIVTILPHHSPSSSSSSLQQEELVIVQEWLKGGHILDEIPYLSNTYSESHASEICHQLISAIAHLHSNNIIHRDIRPEHILFKHSIREQCGTTTSSGTTTNDESTATNSSSTSQFIGISAAQLQQYGWEGVSGLEAMQVPPIAIIDLGMALVHNTPSPPPHSPSSTSSVYGIVGSPGFIAPEVILASHPHSPAMDIFSLGVVMFILLVGRLPFNSNDTVDLGYGTMELVGTGTGADGGSGSDINTAPGLLDTRWDQLSMDAKHLLLGMLEYNPEKRLTATGVMNHPWVVGRGLAVGGKHGGGSSGSSNSVVPCKLGMHVAQGAATVAALRRLTGMDTGVVVIHNNIGDKRRKRYVGELKRVQKHKERLSKASILEKSAKMVAAQTYAKIHDSGGSVDPVNDTSRPSAAPLVGASLLSSTAPDSSNGNNINGLERSGSDAILSVENSNDNGSSKSGIKMLTSSIKFALDASSSAGNNNSRDATGYGGNAGLSDGIKVDIAAAALFSNPTTPIIVGSSGDKISGGLGDGINETTPASQYTVTLDQYAAMNRGQVVGIDDCGGSTSTKSSVSAADVSDRPLHTIKRRGEGSYSSSREGSRSVGRRNSTIPSPAAAGEARSAKSEVAVVPSTATATSNTRATTPNGRKVVVVKPLE